MVVISCMAPWSTSSGWCETLCAWPLTGEEEESEEETEDDLQQREREKWRKKLVPTHLSRYQWVDLRENLQETIDFPMIYGIFLEIFP